MLKFSLPIPPAAQSRPRITVNGGKYVHAYKSQEQQSYEKELHFFLSPFVPDKPLQGPIVIEVICNIPCPKTANKSERKEMLEGIIYPTKSDLDNYIKNISDALTRCKFWQDDRQVVCIHALKKYAEYGSWEVAIYPYHQRADALTLFKK